MFSWIQKITQGWSEDSSVQLEEALERKQELLKGNDLIYVKFNCVNELPSGEQSEILLELWIRFGKNVVLRYVSKDEEKYFSKVDNVLKMWTDNSESVTIAKHSVMDWTFGSALCLNDFFNLGLDIVGCKYEKLEKEYINKNLYEKHLVFSNKPRFDQWSKVIVWVDSKKRRPEKVVFYNKNLELVRELKMSGFFDIEGLSHASQIRFELKQGTRVHTFLSPTFCMNEEVKLPAYIPESINF